MHTTVIIPTKNRPALLARALQSALAQRQASFDILVADDGDGSGAAIATALHDDRIGSFVTGGRGQAAARNMAMGRAKGTIIAFLDDDDWWASDTYLAGVSAMATPRRLAYASGRIVREGSGSAPQDWLPFTASIDALAIRHNSLLLVSGIAYDRALHDELGPLDESFSVYWDWDWYLRLAVAGVRFADSGETAVRISVRPGTVSAAAHAALRQAELDRLCSQHGLIGVTLKNHESIAVEQQHRPGAGSERGAAQSQP